MATILLSAAGAMIGGGFGGTVLGLSGAVIGRAVGATVGRMIDQRLLGGGSQAVETGRIDRFRLTGASEGAPIRRIWGRVRVPGQVIWASQFEESVETRGGGKGAPKPKVTEYSYSVNLAVALCEGPILRIGRIWADGTEISQSDINMRVYSGTEDQEPDPRMEAIEGAGMVPAYRGIAYVVFEDLQLATFGNRVPQFTFEVMREARGATDTLSDIVRGVAMIPGTGEYSLATTPVEYDKGMGEVETANTHCAQGGTDFAVALNDLREELPNCVSVSLVVSWFGSDLRCGECTLRPKVEGNEIDGNAMPWVVNGLARADAQEVAQIDGRPVYGGTPADGAVIEAITALRKARRSVMFYPFILMEQLQGNGLPDPYGGSEQSVLPWRGRITCSVAPGRPASPDGTAQAAAEVAAFFGTAQGDEFEVQGTGKDAVIRYTGSDGWSYRRMVLHYAHLCAAAGGVGAFCIGSEMVGLTTVRGPGNSFPAVEALRALAAGCRAILGPDCQISYAADWSEYASYQPGNGDVFFHLDPLWADGNIDFIGVDNYLPLSDWREGEDHADAKFGAIYNLDYLGGNVCGGEYYDWYYADPAHREAQRRTKIEDGAFGEHWIYRVKDFRGWWGNDHRNRIGGVQQKRTAWRAGMKPIRFTELGCAALNKGANQPNKFLDQHSSESRLPWYSDGTRDDLMQMQYLRAVLGYWARPENNPKSSLYDGQMIRLNRTHIWAWDARPFPQFPALSDVWSDGLAYARGHWLNGRATAQPLAEVVREICDEGGVTADVSKLYGVVRGYACDGGETGRAALQPLMLAHGFDAVERDGKLMFRMRDGLVTARVDPAHLALSDDGAPLNKTRSSEAELTGRMRLNFIEAEADYELRAVEAILPDDPDSGASHSELAMVLTGGEGKHLAHRWLAEARLAQETVSLTLPPSLSHLGAGDVIALPAPEGERRYRVDRAELAGRVSLEAVRVEPQLYRQSFEAEMPPALTRFAAPVPVLPFFMDLPLMTGEETPHAPHVAVTARPWPGSVAVFSSVESEGGFRLNTLIPGRATIGRTLSPMLRARSGVTDRSAPLRVRLASGTLSSANRQALMAGANLMAIGDGSAGNWELFQFETARLVAPRVWELSSRLRGQAGTDGIMPDEWPEGAYVVLINDAMRQIKLPDSARGLVRHYRIGSSRRPWDDPSYVARDLAFDGIGLRPYAPCHLKAARTADGALALRWTRRTRLGGDSWQTRDVPLSEASEAYLVRLMRGRQVLVEDMVTRPRASYSAADLSAAGLTGDFQVEVAQLSEAFGPGPFARIEING